MNPLAPGAVAHPVSLEPFASPELDEALSSARVVLLGEQSHGDGSAFSLKAKLVRHLHLEHGFDVLAFESCFYSLARTWQARPPVEDLASRVAAQVYGHWRKSREMTALWELLTERAGSERPLIVAGIDPRHSGAYARQHLVPELDTFLAEHLPNELASEPFGHFRTILEGLLEHEYEHKVSALDRMHFQNTLWRLKRELANVGGEEADLWRQELASIAYFARNAWGFERRDEGMASNLLWLCQNRYPKKRIIVWTHDWHAARNSSVIAQADPDYREAYEKHPDTPLGEAAAAALGDELFSLTIVAGTGTDLPLAYRGDYETRRSLPEPSRDSIEAQLLRSGAEAAFVNLTSTQSHAFSMSGLEPAKWLNLDWTSVFDGVLFMREIRPLTVRD